MSASSDTKKHLSLSYSASTARPFSIQMDHDMSETIPMPPIIGINNFHKEEPAWFYQRRKYWFSQLHKYGKSICAFFRQTPMCEILGQSHWCSQDSISRIKILISNSIVQSMKTYPKRLNYRYAGFQILDWNSYFQSSLVRTTDKLLQIFTHKDLFTIKNFIHKNILFIKNVTHFPPVYLWLPSHLSFFFSACTILPHYDTILHIAVIQIFI